MNITILNKKGGVGKTCFAFSIAKDLGMYLQSNDVSIIETIYENMAKITKYPNFIDDCVYDFGGFVSSGVIDIVKKCNFVIVPCTPLYNSILRTIETINEVKEVNQNIIVLITDFISEDEKNDIHHSISENFANIEYFFFKHSKILENAMKTGASFKELINENGLSKISYSHFEKEYSRLLKKLGEQQ